jgi:hypothetical protein
VRCLQFIRAETLKTNRGNPEHLEMEAVMDKETEKFKEMLAVRFGWTALQKDELLAIVLLVFEQFLDWQQHHGCLQQLAEYKRILDGVSQDAIDGGWTAKGICAYTKSLEDQITTLKQEQWPQILTPVPPKKFDAMCGGECYVVCHAKDVDAYIAAVSQKLAHAAALEPSQTINEYEAECIEWRKLKEPVTLYMNLLRGFPARLSLAQLKHLIGEQVSGEQA